jgi:hypothetical protein
MRWILKWVLREWGGHGWTQFMWLKTGAGGRVIKPSGCNNQVLKKDLAP